MEKKTAMILGDSYSTFEGHIPEGYAPYYLSAGRESSDVKCVEETWWYTLMPEEGYELVRNDSWSGSTVGYRSYNGADTSKTSSFITRMERLESEGFFAEHEIDTLFIFGATNDSWCGAELGVPASGEISREELYTVLPAIEFLLRTVKRILPRTRIIYLINTDLKPEIGDEIRASAERNGVEALTLTSIDKTSGHPTIRGMADIKREVKAYLSKTTA
jgi:hypothetical protein